MFLLFFLILGTFVLILFLWQLQLSTLHYTYVYIYHPHRVFLAGYGCFEEKILYFNTQINVYHILFTDGTTDYVAAEDFDS